MWKPAGSAGHGPCPQTVGFVGVSMGGGAGTATKPPRQTTNGDVALQPCPPTTHTLPGWCWCWEGVTSRMVSSQAPLAVSSAYDVELLLSDLGPYLCSCLE